MNQQSDTPEYFNAIIARLERERDEARLELTNCKSHFAIHDGKELDESVHMAVLHTLAERDQLRKVADELAAVISRLPSFSHCVEGYNKLPHVIARKETQ